MQHSQLWFHFTHGVGAWLVAGRQFRRSCVFCFACLPSCLLTLRLVGFTARTDPLVLPIYTHTHTPAPGSCRKEKPVRHTSPLCISSHDALSACPVSRTCLLIHALPLLPSFSHVALPFLPCLCLLFDMLFVGMACLHYMFCILVPSCTTNTSIPATSSSTLSPVTTVVPGSRFLSVPPPFPLWSALALPLPFYRSCPAHPLPPTLPFYTTYTLAWHPYYKLYTFPASTSPCMKKYLSRLSCFCHLCTLGPYTPSTAATAWACLCSIASRFICMRPFVPSWRHWQKEGTHMRSSSIPHPLYTTFYNMVQHSL